MKARGQLRLLLSVSAVAFLGVACSTHSRASYGSRSHFNQSCSLSPVCATAPAASTGEIVLPVVERAVEVAETIQGLLTVSKWLTEAEVLRAEAILVECAKEANFKVNERLFGKGNSLPDSECGNEPTVENKTADTWAQHLGNLKHAAAFACVQERFAKEFPKNFSIEPRYRKDPFSGDVILTDRWADSMNPDVVLHFTRNKTRVQCVYDFKFPCGSRERSNPFQNARTLEQLKKYRQLGGGCEPSVITPGLEISRLSPNQ